MTNLIETTDAPENLSTPYSLTFGDTFAGDISLPNESDWLRLLVDGGFGYVLTIRGDGTATSLNGTEVVLRNDVGEVIDLSENFNGTSVLGISPTADGTFIIDLAAASSSVTGSYIFTVEQEIGHNLSSVETLDVGETLKSEIEFG